MMNIQGSIFCHSKYKMTNLLSLVTKFFIIKYHFSCSEAMSSGIILLKGTLHQF